MKLTAKIALIPLIPIALYFVGPKPDFAPVDPSTPTLQCGLDLDSLVAADNAKIIDLKPGNESKIVWGRHG